MRTPAKTAVLFKFVMSTNTSTPLQDLLQRVSAGYRSPDDEFFKAVNTTLLPEFKKLGVITNDEEKDDNTDENNIDCNVPGCRDTFQNVHEYQSHYNSVHRFICHTCKKNLPTPHLLDLHVSETHDSFFQARVDRGDAMYQCYLEECKEIMSTPAARKDHCIEAHKFPANFRFDQIVSKKSSKKQEHKMEVDIPESAAAAKQVKAFTFGHSGDRSFNKACTRRPAGATLENLNDLKDALEE